MNEPITLTIQRLGIHGEGIASLDGLTVFVDSALPEEIVKASLYEVKKNYGRARVLERLQTSPDRVEPPCPVFGRCGGCQLMHLEYAEQLKTKRQRVVDALERIGKIFEVPVLPCLPSPSPLHYRNKIQLPVQGNRLGLYARNSHDLVEIEQCYIHCDLGERVFQQIRPIIQSPIKHVLIKTAVRTNQVLVILVTEGESDLTGVAKQITLPEVKGIVHNINRSTGNTILGKEYRTLAGQPYIEDEICGLRFKVSPASFFQVNPAQAENLYRTALECCDLLGEETVLDAYCGVGTLSLLLAQRAKKVVGIECVPDAIADAKENAQLNQIENVAFHCGDVEKFPLSSIDVAVVNPPRKGCDPAFLERLNVQRLVYISCDPATLARDLSLLQERGYSVDQVQPLDMFPQTVHVETVVQLTKNHNEADGNKTEGKVLP